MGGNTQGNHNSLAVTTIDILILTSTVNERWLAFREQEIGHFIKAIKIEVLLISQNLDVLGKMRLTSQYTSCSVVPPGISAFLALFQVL